MFRPLTLLVSFVLSFCISSLVYGTESRECFKIFIKKNDSTSKESINISYTQPSNDKTFLDSSWQISLESSKDIYQLFLNLLIQSQFSIDQSIETLIKASKYIRYYKKAKRTNLDVSAVYKVLADILGVGDIFHLISKLISDKASSWFDIINLWNQEKLLETYREFIDLISLLDLIDINREKLNDTNKKLVERVQTTSSFKNIKLVLGSSDKLEQLISSLKKYSRVDQAGYFWSIYFNALKQKSISATTSIIQSADNLYEYLHLKIKKGDTSGSSFFQEHLSVFMENSASIILKLERIKRSIESFEFSQDDFIRLSSYKKSIDAVIILINDITLKKYKITSDKTCLYFFKPLFDLTSIFIKSIQNEYLRINPLVNTYKSTTITPTQTQKYEYFTSFQFDQNYINYLIKIYGLEPVRSFCKKIKIDLQE